MDYIGFLTEKRNWLAGDQFSLADIAAAAHLSAIDYIGDVPWDEHQAAKDWYARVKSRPSFQGLLEDRIPGFLPARHYENVDF
jgi:glutathione S-transferase